MPPKYKPGQIAPDSGQYPVVGPRGGDQGREVTVVRGEPFPPTPKPGMGYGKPDKTKHNGKV
ncbi:MAG: YjzC family protein [SAR202 cluster bacterium]|nr:YjzC family protein [SAR202 cluster bacterium]